MFWDWRPSHHRYYIGGKYCSPLAGKPILIGEVLKNGEWETYVLRAESSGRKRKQMKTEKDGTK